jgi:CheY-like chemotaxis protein
MRVFSRSSPRPEGVRHGEASGVAHPQRLVSGAISRLRLGRWWAGRREDRVTDPDRIVIALIEDDPLLRVPLAQALDEAGYRVIAGATSLEGLAMLEDPAVDLAIVDVILPGRMNGVGVVSEARRHNPTLRVLLTSGKPPPAGLAPDAPFLPKPFRVDELLEAVEHTLTAPMDWVSRSM